MSDVSFYPPQPLPDSNGFGEFAFGDSPFGTIPPFNWHDTVISQYANSPILLGLLESQDDAIDPTENYENFVYLMLDVLTAQGYGLDIWGVIVGVSRNLEVANSTYFGFVQGLPGTDSWGPGGGSPWYTGEPVNSIFILIDEAFRLLILAKALANICDGSIPSLNNILLTLFGPGNPFGPGGKCYVTNGANMTMTYTFKFQPNPVQLSIIDNSGVLPTPGGVVSSVVISP
jgi:hypothetical protein